MAESAPDFKEIAKRDPHAMHEAFVKWIKRQTGVATDLESVAIALRLHPHFRVSDEYKAARDEQQTKREAEAQAAAARRTERTQARLDKLKAEAAALEAKLKGEPTPEAPKAPAKTKSTRKPRAPKAETPPTGTPADEVPATAKPQRGRAAAKARAAAKDATVTDIATQSRSRARRGRDAAVATDRDDDDF
jgi:hypothetical protein